MDQYTVSVRLEKKDIRAGNEIRHQFDYFGIKDIFCLIARHLPIDLLPLVVYDLQF